jgi:hypothetical protein
MTTGIDNFKSMVAAKGGLARSNLFQVDLPSFGTMQSRDINLLCKEINIPGHQVMTMEYMMGTVTEKIAYSTVHDDVSAAFLVTNDYAIRKYFEQWQSLAYNKGSHEIGYRSDYCRQVAIHQLDKAISFPILNRSFGTFGLPSNITNRLPTLGPIDFSQGEFDLDFYLPEKKIYTCLLDRAWPISIDAVTLNSDLDGLTELRVQFAYVRWTSTYY